MIILIIFFLIFAIAFLSIRYFRIFANVLSRHRFQTEAAKQAAKMKYKDPVITCDYCGYKFDTSVYSTCPNCGASFDNDPEWIKRHDIDKNNVDKLADEYASSLLFEAQTKTQKTAKLLKRCLTALGIITILLIALGIIVSLIDTGHDYVTKNDKLNEYSFESYEPVDYSVSGDGVIIDSNKVRVTVTGIYKNNDTYDDNHDFKLELHIENNSGMPVALSMSLAGVNSKAPESGYSFTYDWYKNQADIVRYINIYDLSDPEICELVFTDIRISGEDYEFITEVPILTMSTTSSYEYSVDYPDETVLYDDNDVIILTSKSENDRFAFWIYNLSDANYKVKSSDIRINGKDFDSSGIYDQDIPTHYYCITNEVYAYGQDIPNDEEIKSTEISFEFRCIDDPSKNFATGYLNLD